MHVPHVAGMRCNWCSKERPHYRIHRLQSNQVICDYCLEWHFDALEFLGGAIPIGCQDCGKPWSELKAENPLEIGTRLYVVQKDNIYQMLCCHCIKPYAEKREDLYHDTEFWRTLKTA